MNAVLAQIDPGKAIEAADKLAAGNAQTILAYVAVFAVVGFGGGFGYAALWAVRGWLAEIKSCSAAMQAMLEKKTESDSKLAEAIRGSNEVNRAALDALRSKP